MPFPYSASSPVYIYDIRKTGEGGKLDMSLEQFREAVSDRLENDPIPDDLEQSEVVQWRWCWLDGENPINAGAWLVFGVRQWEKRVPGSLLKEMVNKRIEEWRDEQGWTRKSVPKGVRIDIKGDCEQTLTIQTPTAIRVDAIAIDTVNWRLMLFNPREKVREAIQHRLRGAFTDIPSVGHNIVFDSWNMQHYLDTTRPGGMLPVELGHKWLWWLAEKGLETQRAEMELEGDECATCLVELDDSITVSVGEGQHKVTGCAATEGFAKDLEEEMNGHKVDLLKLWLDYDDGQGWPKQYSVSLDVDGNLCKVSIDGEKINANDTPIDAACMMRIDDYLGAAMARRLLFQAFDYGPLQEWMNTAPQVALFPGSAAAEVTWSDGEPSERRHRSDDAQTTIVDAIKAMVPKGTSMTITSGGKSATLDNR